MSHRRPGNVVVRLRSLTRAITKDTENKVISYARGNQGLLTDQPNYTC